MIKFMKNHKSALFILLTLGVMLSTFILEKGYLFFYRNAPISREFSLDRLLIFFLFSLFLGIHFVIKPKKIWDFIYRKRYILGSLLFVVIVINGYHGSSVYRYNEVIQPEESVDNAPFLNSVKPIRSDEYLVDTPMLLSQLTYNNDFHIMNDAVMGIEGKTVLMYPQLPTKSISVISNPKLLGFLFLPRDQAFSFYWYIMIFVGFFATFELCMIITKKRKIYSVMGACLLTFSPAFLWWNQFSLIPAGSAAIVFLSLFLKEKNWLKKLGLSLLFGYAGTVFIMTLYPAWIIPFGYLFLGLFIWQLFENKKNLKWQDAIYLIPVIVIIGIILAPAFMGSLDTIDSLGKTAYPGARVDYGGSGSFLLWNYLISPFFTVFKNIGNACEAGQFIGLYPIPIFIGVFKSYKNFRNKKNDFLLNTLILLAFSMSLWIYIRMPLFSKITLMSISTASRAQLVVNVICILIILRLISSEEATNITKKKTILSFAVSLCICILGLLILRNVYGGYIDFRLMLVSISFFIPVIFLLLLNHKKGNLIFCSLMIAISLFNFATVQPVSKGLAIMSEKPLATAVQKIVKKDKSKKWVIVNAAQTGIFAQSYVLANGARVINSTNYYPNNDLWHKFDKHKKYDYVYNRYAHIAIDITFEETNFELLQGDLFKAKINQEEVGKFDAKYFVSAENLSKYNSDEFKFNKLYEEDHIYIFELQTK